MDKHTELTFKDDSTFNKSDYFESYPFIQVNESSKYLGKQVYVVGKVIGVTFIENSKKGNPTFIMLKSPKSHMLFRVIIWGEDLHKFHIKIDKSLEGQTISVFGKIQYYNGKYQIVVREPEYIGLFSPIKEDRKIYPKKEIDLTKYKTNNDAQYVPDSLPVDTPIYERITLTKQFTDYIRDKDNFRSIIFVISVILFLVLVFISFDSNSDKDYEDVIEYKSATVRNNQETSSNYNETDDYTDLITDEVVPSYDDENSNTNHEEDSELVDSVDENNIDSPDEDYIDWSDAINHIGEYASVKGKIVNYYDYGNPFFFDIGYSYPDPDRFSVIVWNEDRGNFPNGLLQYPHHTVIVTGKINRYKSFAQIELSSPDQIEIID